MKGLPWHQVAKLCTRVRGWRAAGQHHTSKPQSPYHTHTTVRDSHIISPASYPAQCWGESFHSLILSVTRMGAHGSVLYTAYPQCPKPRAGRCPTMFVEGMNQWMHEWMGNKSGVRGSHGFWHRRQFPLAASSHGYSNKESRPSSFPSLCIIYSLIHFLSKARKWFFPMLWPMTKANKWNPEECSQKTTCIFPTVCNTNFLVWPCQHLSF